MQGYCVPTYILDGWSRDIECLYGMNGNFSDLIFLNFIYVKRMTLEWENIYFSLFAWFAQDQDEHQHTAKWNWSNTFLAFLTHSFCRKLI